MGPVLFLKLNISNDLLLVSFLAPPSMFKTVLSLYDIFSYIPKISNGGVGGSSEPILNVMRFLGCDHIRDAPCIDRHFISSHFTGSKKSCVVVTCQSHEFYIIPLQNAESV